MSVDEDVVDRRIAQQRFQRPESEDVVEQFGKERLALRKTDRRVFFGQQLSEQPLDFALGARALRLREGLEIQPVEQLAMDLSPQVEVLLAQLR